MVEWWNSLNSLQYVFFFMASIAIVLLFLQTFLAIIGADHDAEIDANVELDLDCLSFFTVRGLVSFFSVGGVVGFFIAENKSLWWLACLLAFVSGSLALVGMAYLVKFILKLQNEGNIEKKNAIGMKGNVYIRIPKNGDGVGKVNVIVQDSYEEFDAMSLGDEIPTGANIKVVDVRNGILVVEKDL